MLVLAAQYHCGPLPKHKGPRPGIHWCEVVCMLGILGLFLRAAAGHILYLALHLESGSFPRPLSLSLIHISEPTRP